jgi:hypothetical protein
MNDVNWRLSYFYIYLGVGGVENEVRIFVFFNLKTKTLLRWFNYSFIEMGNVGVFQSSLMVRIYGVFIEWFSPYHLGA